MLFPQENHPTTDKAQPKKKKPGRKGSASLKTGLEPGAAAPAASPKHSAAKAEGKTEKVLALLRREDGATLDEMVAATGWQPHTARAALTGLKKKGHVISSDKTDGVRRYRLSKSQ